MDKWYRNSNIGFFYSREQRKLNFPPIIKNIDLSNLKDRIEKYQAGGKLFFRKKWFYFNGIKWNHNIKTGKNYPMIHWSKINALDRELGDIKYVWERSKFSEIQDYLLYDLITGENQIKYILPDIISWIKCNPINTGPNWFCSQEISLRLINWSFFIHFYKEELYSNYKCELLLIIKSIIDQIIHVRSNINYSRKLVQNNHAFTETATLYIIGNIFSYIKLLNDYKKYGRKSFVQEFNNQIFDEGTDSQYSFNYYRTKIQILSFFIIFDNDEFLVKYRKKLSNISVFFDLLMRDNGMVPNYGANDGSLYF
ncbi:MAG: heparinase II/III family protein, partial [Bacilli bacterium]|nr:heparinase II/III family protein [Bacilli bacterium]